MTVQVTTRAQDTQSSAWVEVVRESATDKAVGSYSIQHGTGGLDSVPEGRVALTEFQRKELIRALGGIA